MLDINSWNGGAVITAPCILPRQMCNGIYHTKDKTFRLPVHLEERIKCREISFKCSTNRFARVLKSFSKFARGDCSSYNAFHQRFSNLSHFAGWCFYPITCKVTTWALFTLLRVIPRRPFCSELSYSKAAHWGLQDIPHPKLTAASDWAVYRRLLEGDREVL